jgi:alpha-N-acetylglucosamine transferase
MGDRPAFAGVGARSDRAYVTLVTNDAYLPGAVALVRSLKLSGTAADIVVLHSGVLASEALRGLADLGTRLAECTLLPTSDAFNASHAKSEIHGRNPFAKGSKPSFHTPLDNFVKLRLWQLTEYSKVVFIDADAIVLRNCDRLFDYPEFSAAPNVYESLVDFRRMNSGVFVAQPSNYTFEVMLKKLDAPGVFWRRTDQSFLQTYFPDWCGLSVYDNMLQYVWFNMPELWDWSLIRILHFQYEKPWQADNPKVDRVRPLIELWKAFHDGSGVPADISSLPGPV